MLFVVVFSSRNPRALPWTCVGKESVYAKGRYVNATETLDRPQPTRAGPAWWISLVVTLALRREAERTVLICVYFMRHDEC